MLISPPIILDRLNSETDDQWIDRCMTGDLPGKGAYPVSYRLEWHGGLHLTAPVLNGVVAEPVRAIADGKVIFLRKRTDADDIHDPLNYGPGYTSDACVVIEHTTEIGEGENANVTFYSIYHHLNSLTKNVILNQPIYRKDSIGEAGHLYGDTHRLHFEICCDQTNLQKLVGRVSGTLPTAANGRTDAVFGEIYFTLPAGTTMYAEQPLYYRADAYKQPPKPNNNSNTPWPAIVPLSAAHTTASDLIIGLRYAGGEGGAPGSAYLTTYLPDGSIVGSPLEESEAEYKLYTTATSIAKAWQDAHAAHPQLYPDVPAASAIYELLRFGRIINTGNETLNPATAPHWRKVRYDGGEGWVNLNAATIHQFSDADFPHWKGWQLVDDDCEGADSACDSISIKKLLDIDGNGIVERDEAQAQLDDPKIRERLKRMVCKFPCEWEEATIEQRWAWLQWRTDENPDPYSAEEFADLKAHVKALCIPCPALFTAQWRFEPREFIKLFRKCGWLSTNEFAQCLPRRSSTGLVDWQTARSRSSTHAAELNRMFRKYFGCSRKRAVHVLAQIYIETGILALLNEGGSGNNKPYGAFYGRGHMQLTWAGNYRDFGAYRKFQDHTGPYSDTRITTTFYACNRF